MAVLNIEVDRRGVRQIRTRVRSISEANASAELSAKVAVGVDLISRLATSCTLASPTVNRPQIYVNRGDAFEDLDLFVGSTVDQKLPSWIFAVVEAAHPERDWSTDLRRMETAESLMIADAHADCSANRWIDHYGTALDESGREIFVTEPYSLTSNAASAVIRFAERYCLEFEINAISSHHPSRTVRIAFWPRESK